MQATLTLSRDSIEAHRAMAEAREHAYRERADRPDTTPETASMYRVTAAHYGGVAGVLADILAGRTGQAVTDRTDG